MKLITAIIQPEKLADVKASLLNEGIQKMTVSNVMGAGQQGGYTETYRGKIVEVNLLKKVKIEIAVNDEFVDDTINAVIAGARTGTIGDGKIFVSSLEGCIRIRTGERDSEAIG
jgi:nitrogen regulatory protein P-II 2